jgi:transposase
LADVHFADAEKLVLIQDNLNIHCRASFYEAFTAPEAQRTQLVNMIRGLVAEFGIEIRRGITHASSLAERIAAGEGPDVPALAAKMIASLAGQVLDLQTQLQEIERELLAWHRSSDIARRLGTIPGVGAICATAFAARRLLVVGMTSLVRRAKYKPNAVAPRLAALLSRKPARVVTVALANKAARVIWAIMARDGIYRAPQSAGAVVC